MVNGFFLMPLIRRFGLLSEVSQKLGAMIHVPVEVEKNSKNVVVTSNEAVSNIFKLGSISLNVVVDVVSYDRFPQKKTIIHSILTDHLSGLDYVVTRRFFHVPIQFKAKFLYLFRYKMYHFR